MNSIPQEVGDTIVACLRGPSNGRSVVRYWVMRPVHGDAGPRNEIDQVRWLPLPEAQDLFSDDRDRAVLAGFANGLKSR